LCVFCNFFAIFAISSRFLQFFSTYINILYRSVEEACG
jgi:hypothetical protein